MKLSRIASGVIMNKNGINVLGLITESKEFGESSVVLFPEKEEGIIKRDGRFHISGEGEWEIGDVLVIGNKGEKGCFYLLNFDEIQVLFVDSALDIDDAFRKIPSDIDVFVIPVDSVVDLDSIKKRIDSIDTGAIVFLLREGTEVPTWINEVTRGKELSTVKKVDVNAKIKDKKSFYFLIS